jgi:hypothetical protein
MSGTRCVRMHLACMVSIKVCMPSARYLTRELSMRVLGEPTLVPPARMCWLPSCEGIGCWSTGCDKGQNHRLQV